MTIEFYRRSRIRPADDERRPITSGGPVTVRLRRVNAAGELGAPEGVILDLGPDDHVVLEVTEGASRPGPAATEAPKRQKRAPQKARKAKRT